MKKISAVLLIIVLILTTGCSNAVVPAETSSDAPESVSEVSVWESGRKDVDGVQAHTSEFSKNNHNMVFGKISAISEGVITLEIGTLSHPEGARGENAAPPAVDESGPDGERSRPERPDRGSRPDGAPSKPDWQRDGSTPQGERLSGGIKGGPGEITDLEYSGEQATYEISDSVVITNGIGESGEALTISDLIAGDIVRLVLDDTDQLVSIHVLIAISEGEGPQA